ncbi:uncharacterized protein SOCEGT47_066810 [Sorangium cellulosum]|uniref:Uncharacterized protein n=1 Tax=Sorangium cellulosum TaxID=56 RepID=A0A4P2QA25_SORCE|nr:uncharacterized protein SOCEGT47_066810 [Sorangium cellulosum]
MSALKDSSQRATYPPPVPIALVLKLPPPARGDA